MTDNLQQNKQSESQQSSDETTGINPGDASEAYRQDGSSDSELDAVEGIHVEVSPDADDGDIKYIIGDDDDILRLDSMLFCMRGNGPPAEIHVGCWLH